MIKQICAVFVGTLLMANAHAGFVSGVVVGAMVASPQHGESPATAFISDTNGHDIIACKTPPNDTFVCLIQDENWTSHRLTPAQFAKHVGYNILYKVGYVSTTRGPDLIIMEVGK